MHRGSTTRSGFRALHLRYRARSPTRARHLARGARDRPAEALDRRDGHARREAREADRGFGTAVGTEDRTADAHDALGRLLLIDRVAVPADRSELALQSRERRDRALRPWRELRGRVVEPVDLVVGEEREHGFSERGAVRRQAAADIGHDMRLAAPAARILAPDVDDVR